MRGSAVDEAPGLERPEYGRRGRVIEARIERNRMLIDGVPGCSLDVIERCEHQELGMRETRRLERRVDGALPTHRAAPEIEPRGRRR